MTAEAVLPVYVDAAVARAIHDHCAESAPDEAIGKLYGFRRSWEGIRYVRVVDRATAPCDTGPAHGRFTPEATQACQAEIDARHGGRAREDRPREVGVYHSHPFGHEPFFSATDEETFLGFPYDAPGNVFILVDPTAGWFKVHVVRGGRLEPVRWGEVGPVIESSP